MSQKAIANLVPLFSQEELKPDTAPSKAVKPKTFTNCIADIFNEIIYERKIPLAKVQRETNIPFPTLDDWIKDRSVPLADDNLMILTRYLDTNIEYLCFGIGCEDSRQKQVSRLAEYFETDIDSIEMIMDGTLKKEILNEDEELEILAKESIEWQMKA